MVVRAETTTGALLTRDGNLIELSGDLGQGKPTLPRKADAAPPPIRLVVFDLDRRLAELRASWVEVVEEPRFLPKRDAFVAVVRDLDGRIIELQQALQI